MNVRLSLFMAFVLALFAGAEAFAGISVSSPGAINGTFTIYYGLGSPAPGKIAYVVVRKPNGHQYTVAQAENVSDYSQICYVYANQIGTYRFFYEYSYESQGVPRTQVFYQDYTIPQPPQDNINWTSYAGPSPSEPNSNITIGASFYNPGPSTWANNHYIEFQNYFGSTLYYISVNGHWPGTSGSRTGSVTVPNIGGTGTATFRLRAIYGNVGYFGATQEIPIFIDYRPIVSLSAPSSVMLDQATTVSTTANDAYANLSWHSLDYKPPGGSWVYGSIGANTLWQSGPAGSSYLPVPLPFNIAGDWEIHTRSGDSYGQLSNPVSKTINVYIPTPSATISANSGTISHGGQVVLTVNAVNARYVNVDQVSPNNGYYGNVSSDDETPPSGAYYDLGSVKSSPPPRQLTLTLSNTTASPITYTFRGAVSAGAAWNYSSTVTVTVNPATNPPTITSHPQSLNLNAGQPATFSVSATSPYAISYQWRKNGSDIPGATNASYSIGSVQAADGAGYSCRVTNVFGSVFSNTATLTVNGPPTIVQQPQAQTTSTGQTATFTVSASGTPTLTYQWQRLPVSGSWANVSSGGDYSGATSTSLSISNVSLAMSGEQFRCVVTNPGGSTTSNSAMLTVSGAIDLHVHRP